MKFRFKMSVVWLMLAVFFTAPLAGCKPVDKQAPEEPTANTTDS